MLGKLVMALLIAGLGNVFAAEMNADGSSGCGYGWEVTKEKTLFASSIRSTTNGSASNTIAMTMGTSGCEEHDIVMNKHQQEHFAAVNYENIVADMAQGQGEYLVSFAGMLGCNNTQAFGQAAQKNIAHLAADNSNQMLNNIHAELAQNSALKTACM